MFGQDHDVVRALSLVFQPVQQMPQQVNAPAGWDGRGRRRVKGGIVARVEGTSVVRDLHNDIRRADPAINRD